MMLSAPNEAMKGAIASRKPGCTDNVAGSTAARVRCCNCGDAFAMYFSMSKESFEAAMPRTSNPKSRSTAQPLMVFRSLV